MVRGGRKGHGSRLKLGERSTADIIALMLTVLVVFVMTFAICGGVIWKIRDGDDADLEQLLFRVGNLVNTLIGVVAGYLAGRSEAGTNPKTTAESP